MTTPESIGAIVGESIFILIIFYLGYKFFNGKTDKKENKQPT